MNMRIEYWWNYNYRRKQKILRKKTAPLPISPPHEVAEERNRSSAMRVRRLAA